LHAAVFTCLTTAFFTTACTGELTVKNLCSFDPTLHIKPCNVSTEQDHQGNIVTNFHLPRTKSSAQGENISWACQEGPSDPEEAPNNHMRINAPPQDGPHFAYKDGKVHKPLTRSKFLSILTSSLKSAGLPTLHRHGIRIGSTLEYLLRNTPFDVVKVKGRWSSDTFLIYLCRHAQILALYIQAVPALYTFPVR
ncbi:hypothetical protein V8E55_007202, partial [Tylopilus felleus]